MTRDPDFNDIFAVMSAASVGDTSARIALPDNPRIEDTATRLAIAVNLLLDDLALRTAEIESIHKAAQLELERLVAERTKELAWTNKELEAFSYSVAHDLRAPLRSIDGFSQILLENHAENVDDIGKRYLRLVRESAQRMAMLIDDLLTLSRVTRGGLNRDTIDLTALARSVQAGIRKLDPGRKVDFVVSEGITAKGDERLLAIVLENLLGNAWKFTSKRPSARIEFGTAEKDGIPTYFVSDNGAGFNMEHAGKLFEVFQRLHTVAEFNGTGIGLATVQRVVERHGGKIWAEGEIGRGATFHFTLENEI